MSMFVLASELAQTEISCSQNRNHHAGHFHMKVHGVEWQQSPPNITLTMCNYSWQLAAPAFYPMQNNKFISTPVKLGDDYNTI